MPVHCTHSATLSEVHMSYPKSGESAIGNITPSSKTGDHNLSQFLRELYEKPMSPAEFPKDAVLPNKDDTNGGMMRKGLLPSLELGSSQRDSQTKEAANHLVLKDLEKTARIRSEDTDKSIPESYTVKKGQGFYSIAKDVLTQSDADPSPKKVLEFAKKIAEANGLDRNKSIIHPGQELLIPNLSEENPKESHAKAKEHRKVEEHKAKEHPKANHPFFIPYQEMEDQIMPVPEENPGRIPPVEMPHLGRTPCDIDPNMPMGKEKVETPLMTVALPPHSLVDSFRINVREIPAVDLDSLKPNRPDGGFDLKHNDSTVTYWKNGAVRVSSKDGSGYSLTPSENGFRIHHWGNSDSENFDMSCDSKYGSTVIKEKSGATKTQWADGVVKQEGADGTGFASRPHYTGKTREEHWGPKAEDNYNLEPTPAGSPWSHVKTQRSYAY